MNDEYRSDDSDHLALPLDAAIRATLAEPVSDDAVERVKARARQLAMPSTKTPQPIRVDPRRWVSRSVVGSVVTIAAVLVLVFGLTTWLDRSYGQAFAQVIEKVKAANSVQFTMTTRFGKQPEMDSRMFLEGNRLRIEHFRGTLIQVGDFDQKRAMFLDTQRKLAQQIEMNPQIAKQFANPIDQLRHVKLDAAERIGDENLQGRRTQVYRLRKIEVLGMSGPGEMLVWVDATSSLPARIVCRDPDPKAATEIRFEGFVWNPALDAEMFSLNVPAEFKAGQVVLPPRRTQPAQPGVKSSEPHAQFAEGVLSGDRVPGHIVWGSGGTTITALMRDPETTAPQDHQPRELRQWDPKTGKLRWSQKVAGASWFAGSSDGKLLVTVIGYEMQLRDTETGKIVRTWTTEKQVSPLAFSPDGQILAAGIAEWRNGKELPGGVQLWNVQDGTLIRTISDDKPISLVKYSEDGKLLVTSSNLGPVKLWNAQNGELIRIFPGLLRGDFSPDGKLLACPSSDRPTDKAVGTVNVYNVRSGELVRSLASEKGASASSLLWVTFSPDGHKLVATDWNGSVTMWNVATGERIPTNITHKAGVLVAQFSPEGTTLVTGSEDKMLRLWKLPADAKELVPDKK